MSLSVAVLTESNLALNNHSPSPYINLLLCCLISFNAKNKPRSKSLFYWEHKDRSMVPFTYYVNRRAKRTPISG